MTNLLIGRVFRVNLFAQTPSAKSAKRFQVVDSKGVTRNLNAQRGSAKSALSYPFASTYRAFRAEAQREKSILEVVDCKHDIEFLPPFSRFSRLTRFLPIPISARSPHFRLIAYTPAPRIPPALLVRKPPPRASLLPFGSFVVVAPSSSSTKQFSERERGRENA